jgi:hypothetical protein
MVGAFARGYQLHGMSAHCMPRATVDGLLSLSCGIDGTLPEINVPTDEAAFRYAICTNRDWWPFDRVHTRPKPGLAREMRPSDKGRYLTALLRMSGGIQQAEEIFLSQFWREQFERVGASAKPTDGRIATVKQHLQKKLKAGSIVSDEEWTRLAKVVLAEARNERSSPRYLRFDALQDEFDKYRKSYLAKHASVGSSGDQEGADEREKYSLADSARYLCQKGILLQGHEWRCRRCFNNNWESIDNLKQVMVCDVCGRNEPAPVADPWHFKLNGFVLEGLREHGLLPLIWSLARCSQRANSSFFFLDPHELFFADERINELDPRAELDLLLVLDGMVRLVEAKGSSRGVEISKTAKLAKRLRPNVATLAIMEPKSDDLMKKLSELQKELADSDIKCDLMALDDVDDSPLLPTGTSFWVRIPLPRSFEARLDREGV